MKHSITLSALALLIAAPAFAAPSQLELSAGVAPGVYTQAQITAILSADEEHDAERLRKFFAAENAAEASRDDFSSATPTGLADKPARSELK